MKKTKVQSLEEIIKQKEWYYVNSNLTTAHFPLTTTETKNPKIITMSKYFSSQECLDEIKRQGCRPAMAWELANWAVSHRDEMKKGTSMLAFGQLWVDGGDHGVPCVSALSGGGFKFGLGCFGGGWDDDYCLLCFCDPALSTSDTQKDSAPLTLSPEFDPIDITYIKYRDELTGITAKDYGDTVTIETNNGKQEFVFKQSNKEQVKKVCESILRLINQEEK